MHRRFTRLVACTCVSACVLFVLLSVWAAPWDTSRRRVLLDSDKGPEYIRPRPRISIVSARTAGSNASWIQSSYPNAQVALYELDDDSSDSKLPKAKRSNALVYLTYIVDHYSALPEVVLFVHSQQHSWFNNDMFGLGIAALMQRLNVKSVIEKGYVNLRCEWTPGCPEWVVLDGSSGNPHGEEVGRLGKILSKEWENLHPGLAMPKSLAQPCCSQFAVSRAQVLATALSNWKRYQSWLLKSDLEDRLLDGIFEYIWQFLFTGASSLCPEADTCYCENYKICFGQVETFRSWMDRVELKNSLEKELLGLQMNGKDLKNVKEQIKDVENELKNQLERAMQRGDSVYQD